MFVPSNPPTKQKWNRAYLDIETGSDGTLLDIGFLYNSTYLTFPAWREFLEFLRENIVTSHLQIWAHHGAGFDWVNLAQTVCLEPDFPQPEFMVGGGTRLLGMKFKLPRVTKRAPKSAGAGKRKKPVHLHVNLCDSIFFLPGSLERVCQNYNIDFKKSEVAAHFKEHMEKFKALHPDDYYGYLRDDVCALATVMERFYALVQAKWGVLDLPFTAPSLALRVYKWHYLPVPLYTPGAREKTFTRTAYSGGLTGHYALAQTMTEAGRRRHGLNHAKYKQGHKFLYEDVHHYDVNSMYPAVMAELQFPIEAGYKTFTYEPGILGIYKGRFRQTGGRVPVLKPRDAKGIISEYGEFEGEGIFTSLEIDYLREIGGEFNVSEGLVYEETRPLFRQYALDLYNDRREAKAAGNGALAETAKLLLNSLYGKFGEREDDTEIAILTMEQMAGLERKTKEEHGCEIEISIVNLPLPNGLHLCEITYLPARKTKFREHVFPAIAAFITAAARIKLLRILNDPARQAVYCDTDSVFLANGDTLPPELVDPAKLGAWKLEGHYPWAAFFGKKQYVLGAEKLKAKNKGASVDDAHKYLRDMLAEGVHTSVFYSPLKFKRAVKNPRVPCSVFRRYERVVQVEKRPAKTR